MEPVVAVLCSRNANKARELERLLPGWRVSPLEADGYPEETGATYYENARGKALYGRSVGDPEAWMIGEDSGIEVDGLGGGPGLESARLGGDDPVGWLLAALEGARGEDRCARYVCELVAISPSGDEVRGTGVLDGTITEAPSGTEGFGYDPVFVPDGETRTVAELGNEWKAQNSHRARAARSFLRAGPFHADLAP
ncbi:MAG: non-canonical purine NTP pyrophosphatase [Gaiellaceae bacterium]